MELSWVPLELYLSVQGSEVANDFTPLGADPCRSCLDVQFQLLSHKLQVHGGACFKNQLLDDVAQ